MTTADTTYASPGAGLIMRERLRQLNEEGWTPDHDELEHTGSELMLAAIAYALAAHPGSPCEDESPEEFAVRWWPWDLSWWKPSEDPVRNLVKAGALIAAEIDRLQASS